MANQNPYLDEQPTRQRGKHFAQPVEPEPVEPPRPRRSRAPLVVLVLLALACGGYFGARALGVELPGLPDPSGILSRLGIGERTVAITLNGEEVRVAENSTVQAVFDSEQPAVQAGDLLSVGGSTIEAGGGERFAVTLDGTAVSVADAASAVVREGSSLTFSDGADITEDYTSEVTVTSQPKLVRQVKEGTAEAGYMVQQGVIQYVYQWGKQGTTEVRTGTVSGEVVDGEVVEGQDCIIMCQDVHPDNDEKLVALTFDDGPSTYTQPCLDILDRYGIKATFNLIGEQVEDGADVVRANCVSGNQIAGHTWSHPDLTTLAEDETHRQLNDTFDVIKRVGDYDTSTIRAPYGNIDIDVWLRSAGRLTLSVYWTHDSEDWKVPGVDTIVANCTTTMAPGSVILMHDGGGDRDQNLEALPRIIEAWQNAGYTFVTVEELLASDSSIPEECTKNYRPMPEDATWPTEKAEPAEGSDATNVG